MSATERTPERPPREQARTGCYVYGVLPADVELTPAAKGIGDRDVGLVRRGQVAALVSEVDLDAAIGRPEDLTAHERLLDGAAAEVPVLPLRFGAVLADEQAVAEELLEANHDQFVVALNDLEGRVEYLVKIRYEERPVLTEILRENPEAARLRERIRGEPEERTREARMRLGELIDEGISTRRSMDTRRVVETLSPFSVAHNEREPTHREDAANVAFLVETAQRARFEKAVEEIAQDWRDRANVRLLGPLAPYDFVVTGRPGG